jgi:hypothetical protein
VLIFLGFKAFLRVGSLLLAVFLPSGSPAGAVREKANIPLDYSG